jgi:hypothetical protein
LGGSLGWRGIPTISPTPLNAPLATATLLITVRVPDTPEATMTPWTVSLPLVAAAWRRANRLPSGALGRQGDQERRPAMKLTEPATITTPNTYDRTAWESTLARIRRSPTVVSDT